MARLRTAVIGVGHLGKEHARILSSFADVELMGVVDLNVSQANEIAQRCRTQAYADHRLLLDVVDAVTIAVPTNNHFRIAFDFLQRGISVLVEKPLTDSLRDADALVELAQRRRTLLQVGHIERFNPAFEEARRLKLQPTFIKSERVGPFSGRSTDIGVVLDLLIHDLDLLIDLIPSAVDSVEAIGWTIYGRHEDVCHARLRFGNGCEAHVSASRASPTARRQMQIWTESHFTRLDFGNKTVAIGETPDLQLVSAQNHGGLRAEATAATLQGLRQYAPESAGGDQLTRELRDFVDCAGTERQPRVPGVQARQALDLAFKILQSLQSEKPRGRAAPWYIPLEGEAAA